MPSTGRTWPPSQWPSSWSPSQHGWNANPDAAGRRPRTSGSPFPTVGIDGNGTAMGHGLQATNESPARHEAPFLRRIRRDRHHLIQHACLHPLHAFRMALAAVLFHPAIWAMRQQTTCLLPAGLPAVWGLRPSDPARGAPPTWPSRGVAMGRPSAWVSPHRIWPRSRAHLFFAEP